MLILVTMMVVLTKAFDLYSTDEWFASEQNQSEYFAITGALLLK